MNLEKTCDRCLVSKTCPKSGSSPMTHKNKRYICRLIGGYGKSPVDESILSEESKKIAKLNGYCMTVAEIPIIQIDGNVGFELTKIFSQPIVSDRQKTSIPLDSVYAKNHIIR
jgi:hypothetical protein